MSKKPKKRVVYRWVNHALIEKMRVALIEKMRVETNEQAADLCALCASLVGSDDWSYFSRGNCAPVLRVGIEQGFSFEAIRVALDVVGAVRQRGQVLWLSGFWNIAEFYAEAESFLRCGQRIAPGYPIDMVHELWLYISELNPAAQGLTIEEIWAGALDQQSGAVA